MWIILQRRLPSIKTATLVLVVTCAIYFIIVRNYGIPHFGSDDVIARRDSLKHGGKVTLAERSRLNANAGGSRKSIRNEPRDRYKDKSMSGQYPLSDLLYNVDYKLEAEFATKGGPMNYLPEYKNPCWMSSISSLTDPDDFNLRRAIIPVNRKSLPAPKLRCAPGVYQVGAAGSGTTDLFNMLTKFSDGQLVRGHFKEPRYWSHWRTNQATFSEYLDLFATASESLAETARVKNGTKTSFIIDGSTFNFIDYKDWRLIPANRGRQKPVVTIPKTLKALTPDIKIIIIVRNPTDRLLSQFRSMKEASPLGASAPEAFDRAVRRIIPLWETCIRSNGTGPCLYDYYSSLWLSAQKEGIIIQHSMYYFWVRSWMEEFGSDKVILLRAEDYYRDKAKHTNRVLKFLGLDTLSGTAARHITMVEKAHDHKAQPMLPETRAYLDNFFKPYNKELAEYVQDDGFLWNDI